MKTEQWFPWIRNRGRMVFQKDSAREISGRWNSSVTYLWWWLHVSIHLLTHRVVHQREASQFYCMRILKVTFLK